MFLWEVSELNFLDECGGCEKWEIKLWDISDEVGLVNYLI